ncbi:MAG: hypothetical protein RL385_5743 [Pseudomonadota bacterium]
MTDCITLCDLEVRYRVGVPDEERQNPQRLLLTVQVFRDFNAAIQTDSIDTTTNYFAISERLKRLGDHREWKLIEKLAGDIAALVLAEFPCERVAVEVLGPSEGICFDCDPDLIRRVLENLLDNALRYTPSRSTVQLGVGVGEQGELMLSVADGGPGIPEAERERVFEKYAQLDRADDRAQQRFGRGIGLTFVKMAVEAHGGRIWVEDRAVRGACFQIRLPKVT